MRRSISAAENFILDTLFTVKSLTLNLICYIQGSISAAENLILDKLFTVRSWTVDRISVILEGKQSSIIDIRSRICYIERYTIFNVERSQRGYFNGLPFHRVIKHFVIQGGDPKFAGTREEWTVGGQLNGQLEFNPKHEAFMLATSKPENQGGGFELFIIMRPIPDLNDKLTVFGRVIKGEDVQEIEEVDTDKHFWPKSPIIINDVTLKDEL